LLVFWLFAGADWVHICLTAVNVSGRYMAVCDVEHRIHVYHLKKQKVTVFDCFNIFFFAQWFVG